MFRSMPFLIDEGQMLYCQCERKTHWDFPHASKKLSLPVYPWKVFIRELSTGQEVKLPTKLAEDVIEKSPVGYFSQEGLCVSLVLGSLDGKGKPQFNLNRFLPCQQESPEFYRPTNLGFTSRQFVCTGESLRLRDKPYDVFIRHKDSRRYSFIDTELEFCSSVIPVREEPKVILTGRIKGQTKSVLVDFLLKKAFDVFSPEGKPLFLFSLCGPVAAYCVEKGDNAEETDIEIGLHMEKPSEIGLKIEGTF